MGTQSESRHRRRISYCTVTLLTAGLLSACVAGQSPTIASAQSQPSLEARGKPVITVDGLRFKDLSANGALDAYEDWRLPASVRAEDLVGRMTLAEKAGLMLIATHNPACDGSVTADGRALIEGQNMARFILRATATDAGADCSVTLSGFALRGGYDQTPTQLARFTNAVQEMREATRLGIPAQFKDNARNHVEVNPTFGITQGAGSFTEFPKEAGLAAAALGAGAELSAIDGRPPADLVPDMQIIRDFTSVMGREWRSIGMRGMYGYMLDLGTEPRWSRFHETFSEDADLVGAIARQLVSGLQGTSGDDGLALSPDTSVSLTLKHFPGGGPQQLGLDAHYTFGKNQFYTDPSGEYGFDYHLRPFASAIDAGASAIMPYYGVPVGAVHGGVELGEVGMAFSPEILTDLLREEMGFQGYVNSDSGIIEERGWGLEDARINPVTGSHFTVADRTLLAIKAGTDILSEFRDADTIIDLVNEGRLDEQEDIDPSVERLLIELFALGLFENPYIDADAASANVGSEQNRLLGLEAQHRSIVLLENRVLAGKPVLPLQAGSSVYVMGADPDAFSNAGLSVVDGNYSGEEVRPQVPEGTDLAVLNVVVSNGPARSYRSDDPATGGRSLDASLGLINSLNGELQQTWAAQDPCIGNEDEEIECVDSHLVFGGSFPWEAGDISISAMAESESWVMYPTLEDIREVVEEIGDPQRAVISVYFRNPYVLDEESGFRNVGALMATFGVSDRALAEVLAGKASPGGRLPFALPASLEAVREQHSDAPGYAEVQGGALYPFGYGLGYR